MPIQKKKKKATLLTWIFNSKKKVNQNKINYVAPSPSFIVVLLFQIPGIFRSGSLVLNGPVSFYS